MANRETFSDSPGYVGVGYFSRRDNRGAKAGNTIARLPAPNSPFVAIFDCDHIPNPLLLTAYDGVAGLRMISWRWYRHHIISILLILLSETCEFSRPAPTKGTLLWSYPTRLMSLERGLFLRVLCGDTTGRPGWTLAGIAEETVTRTHTQHLECTVVG
jgi:hypothetical protein